MPGFNLLEGDANAVLPALMENQFDALFCDPPYGLSFMGKAWDHGVPSASMWSEALRVCKPGAHLLAFGGPRTFHRLVSAIEDAGWEVRDVLMWVYGSGFPKSLDVSKALDKEVGAERTKIRTPMGPTGNKYMQGLGDDRPWRKRAAELGYHEHDSAEPATEAARIWSGYGTALKPAYEPIILARKPLVGTVARNAVEWGCGALNIDGGRVGSCAGWVDPEGRGGSGWHGKESLSRNLKTPISSTSGRWPANLIHDGSPEVLAGFPTENARFYYCAKASPSERGEGNKHPTVKPLDLCRYLANLIRPPVGGSLLVPFSGSGSEMIGALRAGWPLVTGIEQSAEYAAIARGRLTPHAVDLSDL